MSSGPHGRGYLAAIAHREAAYHAARAAGNACSAIAHVGWMTRLNFEYFGHSHDPSPEELAALK